MASYDFTARGYLKRARSRLVEATEESLLYAALELRSGIEARMKEYLETQTHISHKLREGWRIPEMAKGLRQAFDIGDKFLLVRLLDSVTNEELTFFVYTPVTRKTQKLGAQLGEYLHAPQGKRDEAWWKRVKATVIIADAGLENATLGSLLGVPLVHPNHSGFSIRAESWEPDDRRQEIIDELQRAKRPFKLDIRYFDELVRKDTTPNPGSKH